MTAGQAIFVISALLVVQVALGIWIGRLRRRIGSYRRAHALYRAMLADLNVHLATPKTWHDLKCHPPYFDQVHRGVMTFQVRFNDRKFMPGDGIRLREYTPGNQQYTGRSVCVFVLGVFPILVGVRENYVVMSLRIIAPPLD